MERYYFRSMSMFIASLNSGSNGNCYYVGNADEAVLVDAGISCRETVKRMNRIGLDIQKVKAIFISHEHGDHIAGLAVLARRYQLPVYITQNTFRHSRVPLETSQMYAFAPHEPVTIGALKVVAFPKAHDAIDPHSFMISDGSVNIGVFTDLGVCCKQLIAHFKQCHAAFLEANYDVEMLANGSYPYHLKKRISGGEGHLSNTEALQLFLEHRPAFMSHLLLAHLSKNNNDPQLVERMFSEHAAQTKIIIAGRYKETDVYHITSQGDAVQMHSEKTKVVTVVRGAILKKTIAKKTDTQLSLF